MDIRELIQNAINVEQQGVPVNWKEMCITAVNVATHRVVQLEKQLEELSPPPED